VRPPPDPATTHPAKIVRTLDLLFAGLSSLRRQKLRTTLTLLGVAIGIATLVASVSVGLGVRRIIEDGFKKQHRLRAITVYPGFDRASDEYAGIPSDEIRVDGQMSDERRERLRRRLAREWRMRHTALSPKPLTPARLREFASWEHVIDVEPALSEPARLVFRGRVLNGDCTGFTGDAERVARVVEFGHLPAEGTDEVMVHEFLLYEWGVRSDDEIRACLGQTIRAEFTAAESRRPEVLLSLFDADPSKLTEQELKAMARARELLPKAIEGLDLSADDKAALLAALGRKRKKDPTEKDHPSVSGEFRIVGVYRSANKAEGDAYYLLGEGLDGEVVLPQKRAEEFFARLPVRGERGFNRVTLTVDSDEHLKPVCDRLKDEGFNYFAIGLFLQTARKNALLIGFTMDFVALIALGVACLGIMNTLFTAVLERVKEIGVMKAVGAKDRHILAMFLIEGGLIGFVGGWLGVLIGWLVSFPGDGYALRLIKDQEPNMPPPETVFRYPLWLVFGAPLFAAAVTTLASLLPARRAARVEPVVALRAE
jgi:putative ABC transport system permease protein